MGLTFRESADIRPIQSIEGDTYFIRKSAYGFAEQISFFDKDGNELETFLPDGNYDGNEDIYEYDEHEIVEVDGRKIQANFSYAEWYISR